MCSICSRKHTSAGAIGAGPNGGVGHGPKVQKMAGTGTRFDGTGGGGAGAAGTGGDWKIGWATATFWAHKIDRNGQRNELEKF